MILLTFSFLTGVSQNIEKTTAEGQVVEIRSYTLKQGTRKEYHQLAHDVAIPLLLSKGIRVVAYGPSLHDEDSYYLIRVFESLKDRERQEVEFYESDDWTKGPQNKILSMIQTYTTIIIPADENLIKALSKL
jgi:hypothetical protein